MIHFFVNIGLFLSIFDEFLIYTFTKKSDNSV